MIKLLLLGSRCPDYDQLFLIVIYLIKADQAAPHDYDQGLGYDLQYSRFRCLL
jgi:hypothetical protein